MHNPVDMPSPIPLSAGLLAAWLDQSNDLLAVTDAQGFVVWANSRFRSLTGHAAEPTANLLTLLPPGPEAEASRAAVTEALGAGALSGTDLQLQSLAGAQIWVRAHAATVEGRMLWTLQNVTAARALAGQVRHTAELLDMAQEFGRLGVWERDIPSGVGRWDRHVFNFWGLDPAQGTPSFEQAIARIHPDDRSLMSYRESTRQAGHYAQRYRVLHPDGNMRWIHSQWEVKNSSQGQPDRAVGIMVDDTEVYEMARSLGDASAQLNLAVELGNIAIWRHDLKTNRMHYNDRAYAVLDIAPRPEGLSIEEVRDFIHPDDVERVVQSAAQALQSDRPTDMEARYRRTDGSWRYVLTRRVVQRAGDGTPLAFLGVALDVTEQVEHSRRAEELARRLDAAAQAARVGLWTTNVSAAETDWNAQMFELFDMVGASQPPTLSQWVKTCIHPDDRERVGRESSAYLKGGDAPFELELRTLRRDGSSRWMVMRGAVEPGSADARRVFGVVIDVTEQHQALAALRSASERSALITRGAGIGTWEMALDGSDQRWDEQMFRLRGMEPRAQPPTREERLSLVHPDDLPSLIDSQEVSFVSHPPSAYEFRVRWPDGSLRWLASRSAPVMDERGDVVRRVGVNWDITERKNSEVARQEKALAERESLAKSQFLARMSHELRTPMNAVLGFTQLLQLEAAQTPSAIDVAKLGHIRSAGEHLLSLINDVLDLSSLESGNLKLDLQAVNLAELVAQALPLVEPLATRHQVSIRSGVIGGAVWADRTRLLQVLVNLLSNAIKYNRPQGHASVETRQDGARLSLLVRDNGRGLSKEQQLHLFEPFNRLGIESHGIEGTGIGLVITKALLRVMGGTISASSEPSVGTLFEVSLPSHEAAPSVQAPPANPFATSGPAALVERYGQLLYIEDNAVNVTLVEELVKSLSFLSIVSEPNGALGVARARSLRPDLILVDMQLPDFDGFEVLRRLRAQSETATTPCIALSANAMPDDIARALRSGFADYWTKPINFKAFLASLESLFPVRTHGGNI